MKHFALKYVVWGVLGCAIIAGVGYLGWRYFLQDDRQAETATTNEELLAEESQKPIPPEFINLQPIVDEWLGTYRHGNVAIAIYDLDHEQIAATYNADKKMLPASVYKLFYTYDAYQQIDAGNDDPDKIYWNSSTLGECLDLMIRESHNPCAETMLDDPPRAARVATLIQDQGMTNTIPTALMTSANDITKLMQLYYKHEGWSEASWEKFLDSALNQPPTSSGDFRQGLPSGFKVAKVYNKVGWSAVGGGWDIYNDVALINFPESKTAAGQTIAARNYSVVVLTRSTSHLAIADLGEMLEQAVLEPIAADSSGEILIEENPDEFLIEEAE